MTSKKTIVTITGIRPDFIRMCCVFKKLDEHYHHIMIHTGQHFDKLLSDVFFEELGIRKPDYILNTGKESSNHYEQLSYLTREVPKLFAEKNIKPDLILFLGDANTSGLAFPLKKGGYKIGHIEAGMRSGDKRMLEEINRTVCDHCSDYLFVYHDDYASSLAKENITRNVFVVGNTIVEPFRMFQDEIMSEKKKNELILLDIHRPENFFYRDRLECIIKFANICVEKYGLSVKMLYFKRLMDKLQEWKIDLGKIEVINLLPFKTYLKMVYDSYFIISDSGTGQEEPALLNTPVIVPRDFTERPQSYASNCSRELRVTRVEDKEYLDEIFNWIDDIKNGDIKMDTKWLGVGNTSELIIKHLKEVLN